jgi:tetratricopeptide (TPR) repeat protein
MSERDIFIEALQRPDQAERRAYLVAACGTDLALRRGVEALLRKHENAGSFLESPASALADTVEEPAVTERPGTVIGAYKLLEQIGEGGFGIVFMAEQQEPIRRKVALKVLKPGMDSKQVIARFEAERQALALMDHPHIAKVLDAGQTSSGRPYFVMELVKGLPITDYCDQAQLPPRDRLELFVDVCQAVQHAHQKGIIHRDIKPSNVLVTMRDDPLTVPSPPGGEGTVRGVVKVIDFGIAKALGQQLTDKTLLTGIAQMIGTPLYMSPEQAALSNADVDTRSDIHALGVLLYELLTGTTPFDKERLQQVGYDEMRRIIREEEPPRPSTRLSTVGQAATTASEKRRSEPGKLSRLMRGELDWIVMKALEKERNRRYETASAFAADVQRYLHDEPVQACPPTGWYRFRKFARRNKRALAVAGLVLFCIASLGSGVGWVIRDRAARQAKVANDLELTLDRAELFLGQGKRAEALAALERAEILTGEAPHDSARDERLAAIKERLDAAVRDQEFLAQFADIRLQAQSRVNVEESRFVPEAAFPEIGQALGRYGIEIGVTPAEQAAARVQGRPEPARQQLLAALDECLSQVPQGDPQAREWLLATLNAADNHPWRVRVRKALVDRDWTTLEPLARAADMQKQPPSFLLIVARSLPAQMKSTRLELFRKIQRAYPADLWANHGLADELMHNGRPAEAIRYYTAALTLLPDNPGIYVNRGIALKDAGELEAAIADYRLALALAPQYVKAHYNLAQALNRSHQFDEAIVEYRAYFRHEPGDAVAHYNFGIALGAKEQLDEAIVEYRKAIGLQKDFAKAHFNLGQALGAKGQLDQAITELNEAVHFDPDDALNHYGLGNALCLKGRLDKAIAEYREAIRLKPDYAEVRRDLAQALARNDQLDEAIVEYRDYLRRKAGDAVAHYNLGLTLSRKRLLDDAITEYREAVRLKKDFTDAHFGLANTLYDQHLLDDAISEYREAIRLQKDFADAHNNLGNALYLKGLLDEAIAEYHEAIRINKDLPAAHYGLGNAFRGKGRLDNAIAEYREAIRINRDYADAHFHLGNALFPGRPDDAIAEYREAIRINRDYAEAHFHLGNALVFKGLPDEAIAAYREALRVKKDYPDAYANLGNALHAKGLLDEAIAAYQEAIRLQKDLLEAYYNLGLALSHKGDPAGAIGAYQKAIALKPDFAEAHCNLGHALRQRGEFRKALEELRRGHELGSKNPGWPYPSAQWIRQCERLIELDRQLPSFLENKAIPTSPEERIELAALCTLKHLHRAAAGFSQKAFADKPQLAEDLQAWHRYNAACEAALAGCGEGKDASQLDAKERARLRRQALDWLRADLAAWAKELARNTPEARGAVRDKMQHWRTDTDFAGVRGAEALAKLPEVERRDWQQLWSDVADLLKRAQEKPAPEKK